MNRDQQIGVLRRALAGEALISMTNGLGDERTDKALGLPADLSFNERYELLEQISGGEMVTVSKQALA